MLPAPTLPESWRALLDAFRPAFRRSRTFALFALLATGLVTQTTRRTVVGMLAGAGMAAAVSFHAVCRFFSQPCVGHRPDRADAGPADRVPVAGRRRGDRGGGRRYAVS